MEVIGFDLEYVAACVPERPPALVKDLPDLERATLCGRRCKDTCNDK
jgi:hypothetical protein